MATGSALMAVIKIAKTNVAMGLLKVMNNVMTVIQ